MNSEFYKKNNQKHKEHGKSTNMSGVRTIESVKYEYRCFNYLTYQTLTYVFNCLTKLEKLLCLKYLGKRSLANSGGFHTTKLLLVGLQETIESVAGSSTMS